MLWARSMALMGLLFAAVAYGGIHASLNEGMFFGGIGMIVLAGADMIIRAQRAE